MLPKDLKDIPEEFKDNPEVIRALELAEESAYTAAELEAYDEYLDAIRVEQTLQEDSYEEGEQIGIAKGEQKLEEEKKKHEEERKNMARLMIQEGMDIQKVSKITGLPENEITSF